MAGMEGKGKFKKLKDHWPDTFTADFRETRTAAVCNAKWRADQH